MKKPISLTAVIVMIVLSAGCQNTQNRTGEGAVIGGLLGAAAGGIIGHQDGHGGEGAAIGAAAGALTGALVGSQVKKQPQPSSRQPAQSVQAANPNQMPLQQIVSLTKQGVNEDVIIDKVRLTSSRYSLSQADIDYLKNEGVSQKVISAMQAQQ